MKYFIAEIFIHHMEYQIEIKLSDLNYLHGLITFTFVFFSLDI